VPLNCAPSQQSGLRTPAACRLGSPKLVAVPLNCSPQSLGQQSSFRTPAACRLGSPVLTAATVAPVAWWQQAGLRALITCRLGSPVPAAAAVAPGCPCPNASRPQGLCCLVGTRWFKPSGFASPWVPSTCYSVPGASHHTPKWTPGSRLCYFAGSRRLSTPQSTEAQPPHCLWQQKSPHSPIKEQKLQIPHWEKESYSLLHCRQHQKPCFPQGTQKPSASYCTSLQESHVSPVWDLESQIFHRVAIHYSAGAPHRA
jgi:hypothetical protein